MQTLCVPGSLNELGLKINISTYPLSLMPEDGMTCEYHSCMSTLLSSLNYFMVAWQHILVRLVRLSVSCVGA